MVTADQSTRNLTLKIKRYDPEHDTAPHWEQYAVAAEPWDRVLDVIQKVKWYHDDALGFRRSCAHGVCGSDAMRINGVNGLACKILVKNLRSWWQGPTDPETLAAEADRQRQEADRETIKISQGFVGKQTAASLLSAPTSDLLDPDRESRRTSA